MDLDRERFSDNDDSPMSNSTPRSHSAEEDDDKDEEFHQRSSPTNKFLDVSPPHDVDAYAQQQREILERLKEQFSSFPFTQAPNFAGMDLSEHAQLLHQQQRLQHQLQLQQQQQQNDNEAHSHPNDFPFSSFPTPPPSKGEEDLKISSSKKSSSQHNSSWSYEDQYKQVRQLYEINDDPKRKEFLDDLFMFMKERGTPINRLPIMAKSVLDLYELYKLVIGRGGLVNVINKKLWQEIIKDLNLPSSITSAAFTLRTQYTKYLYPYETEKYNLSTEVELQAAIDNNKRDGSRRSTSNNYGQFSPQSPPNQHQQLQMAMAQQFAAATANNAALNLSASNGSANNQVNDLSNSQQANEIQLAQQRFMMMMFLYQQFLQSQTQST